MAFWHGFFKDGKLDLSAGGLSTQGTWAEGFTYGKNDVVSYDGSSYIAVVDHTAGLLNAPPDTDYWMLNSSKGETGEAGESIVGPAGPEGGPGPGLEIKEEYDPLVSYDYRDLVSYQGSSYIARVPTLGNLPTDTDFWTLNAEKGSDGLDGGPGSDGAAGQDGVGVPTGGTTGQVLAKNSGTDYDTEWVDQTGGGGGGSVAWDDVTDKPLEFPPSIHTHDDRYYTETESDAQLALKASTADLDNAVVAIDIELVDLDDRIDIESGIRAAADIALDGRLDTLEAADNVSQTDFDTLEGRVTVVEGDLTTESSTRASADTTLQSNIDDVSDAVTAEATARSTADDTLQDNIDAEATARTNADTAIDGRLDILEAADNVSQTDFNTLEDRVTETESDIAAETTARTNADTTLQSNIDAEETARIDADTTNANNLTTHASNTNNPHSVTKAQVGLGNVDDTSDIDKPVSTATQDAIDAKLKAITIERSIFNSNQTGAGPMLIGFACTLLEVQTDGTGAAVLKKNGTTVSSFPATAAKGDKLTLDISGVSGTFVVNVHYRET